MKRFPAEFEAILTPRGRRILAGNDPACGAVDADRPFVSLGNVVDPAKAEACRKLLEAKLLPHLSLIEQRIPASAMASMKRNYAERLPKTVRAGTAYLDDRRSLSSRIAADLGVVAMLKSESYRAFAQAVAGRPLRKRGGAQVLCYRAGDYAGPHNDHHPEEPEARDGYLDMHVSLTGDAVAHQWLVYEEGGHFSGVTGVHTLGGVTVYRLPFWHYTTPLVAKPGREAEARRWLLLGTFLFAKSPATRANPTKL